MASHSPGILQGLDLDVDAVDSRLVEVSGDEGYKLLVKVDEELGNEDLRALKFLCRDIVSDSKLEKVTRGIKLFEELKNSGRIIPEEGKFELLTECLFRIHRLDLVRKLKEDPKKIRRKLSEGILASKLSPFRIMLFEVGEDISTEEYKSVTFLLSSDIPRAKIQKMSSVFDLFIYLERNDFMSPEDVEILIRILKDLDRGDLKKKVEKYKNDHEGHFPGQVPPGVLPNNLPGSGSAPELHRVPSAGTVSNVSMEEMPVYQRQDSQPLSDNALLHLSPELQKYPNWKDLAPELGFTSEQFNEILSTSSMEVMQIYKALMVWRDHIMNRNPSCRLVLIFTLRKMGFESAASILEDGIQPIPRSNSDPAYQAMEAESSHQRIDFRDSRDSPAVQSVHPVQPVQPFRENKPQIREDRGLKNITVSGEEAQVSLPFVSHMRSDSLRHVYVTGSAHAENVHVRPQLLDQGIQSSLPVIPAVIPEPTRADQEIEGMMRRAYLDDEMDLPTYKMDSKPRGICIVINNEEFYKVPGDAESKEMPGRTGTHIDAEKLQYIFQKMEFIVMRRDNLSDVEMARWLVEISYQDHSQYDCFVCCVLSHGALGHVYGTNGRLLRIQTLTSCFQSQRCPGLAGKPKLFFIQACQGREKQQGVELEADAAMDFEDAETDAGGREMIPDEADFILGYATVPGYVSYRSRSQGSWYINKLVEMLDKYAYRYDLLSILVKVNEEVGRANANMDGGKYKQIPAPLVTLRKKLFFR